ncbi:MAG: NAD(P)-dependent alcohol dehydrogenase [Phycisphaeraceae bacterium]|nr:NAD(P)-dependent alcohol dehydrogenase [Phycisphaeraceae bacterium]
MKTTAYAAAGPGQPLEPCRIELEPLRPDQIRIEVTHCGVCHSDLHMLKDDWGMSKFPLVAGHEVVGNVIEVGDKVERLKRGQRVGVGWQSGCCGGCECCQAGDEHFCPSMESTCVHRHGGFAHHVQVQDRLAIPLPESLDSATAAPLLCSGITIYNPLIEADVKRNTRVGIMGIGGLGHLGLQFAHAMGARTIAISSSPHKAREARDFGASEFVLSTDLAQMKSLRGSLDLLLSTIMVDWDWAGLLGLLRPRGRLWLLGPPPSPLTIPAFALIGGQRSVTGSPIGSPGRIVQMLEFAMHHGISPAIEPVPFDRINQAIERAGQGKVRYQTVLHH